ncbi:MAG: FAD-dependent oxidoreductase [Granulosicoccus sp.]
MKKTRIVIVGGGFGGVFTARHLRRMLSADIDVEIVNTTNYFVFQPLLPEVASGNISAPDAVTPLRQLLPGVKVRMGTVISIDKDARYVELLQGSYRTPQKLHYDHLVIAAGQETNLDIAPGFREHALSMRNLADAHELRNKIIRRLEHADITEDAVIKERLLTFVVGGGGFSGVETVGEISEMVRRTLRFYPNVEQTDIRTVIVQSDDRLLTELPEKLGLYAGRILRERGVNVIVGKRVQSASANAVYLSDGERIETCLFVSTVGNGPTRFCNSLGLPLERGKIPVDRCLKVRGEQNIWALGDAALIPMDDSGETFAPPTAQFAVREAKSLANNVACTLSGHDPIAFTFKPKGALASIGHYKGVAQMLGMNFSGLLAWMTWRFLYIGMLPNFSTRLRVALNWAFDFVMPRSIVQIAIQNSSSTSKRRYSKGDTVSMPGQLVDGFYAVLDGTLESRVPQSDGKEDFVRILSPGEHWGEVQATVGAQTVGTLTALEDSRVIVLKADDFRDLRAAIPAFNEYFEQIDQGIYPPALRSKDNRVRAKS